MSYRYDPELQPIIDLLPAMSIEDIAEGRRQLDEIVSALNLDVDTTGLTISDELAPGPTDAPDVPVRVYRPDGDAHERPGFLAIHGGGFVMGSIAMEHAGAAQMASALDAVVVAVEYRLGPEHPFPAGVEDCYAALIWFHEHAADLGVDPARIAVGGQSAGGGLAAAVSLMARDRGGPPVCFQFLGIPELDDRLETDSMKAFTDTPLWHRPNAELSWKYYLGTWPADDASPYAAPARAADLSGLPPAYVTTMEFDPLRDEGITYALRMMQAGVPVELHSYPGTFHGSALVTEAAISKRSNAELIEVLRRALAPSPDLA
jgi:acetyl esterase/lipase